MVVPFHIVRNWGLGILVLLIAGISFSSLFNLAKTTQSMDLILEKEEPILERLDVIQHLLAEARYSLQRYIHREKIPLDDIMAPVERAVEECYVLESMVAEEEKEIIEKLRMKVKYFRVAILNFVAESQRGSASATNLIEGTAAVESEVEARNVLVEVEKTIKNRIKTFQKSIRDEAQNTQRFTFFAAILSIVIAFLLSLFMGFALTKPIRQLVYGTERIAKGDLDFRVQVTSHDEIGQLANSFNKMAEDLSFSLKKEKELAVQATLVSKAEKKKSDELLKVQNDLEKYAVGLIHSNKELEEFVYIASHDLQEPLRKVKTFGERLIQKYRDVLGDQGQDYLKRMENAISRMQTLINDLLTYSRVTSRAQPFIPVNLNNVVSEVLSDLEIRTEETNAKIHVDDLSTIDADPVQMRQLFQNLISNALKFSRAEAPLVVELRSILKLSKRGDVDKESMINEWVREFKVTDNGIGFEEQYKEQIFSVFERLHGRSEYEGTGIGLAVCRKIVTRHGGNIKAESTPGQGTTFIITLPILHTKEKEKGDA